MNNIEFDRYNVGESIDRCVLVYTGLMSVEVHFSKGVRMGKIPGVNYGRRPP